MTGLTLSAVLPAFNEGGNLPIVVPRLSAVLRSLPLRDWEIIIVDNASTDGTGWIADQFVQIDPQHIRAIHNPRLLGYAQSLKLGLDSARHELIFYMDADNQCEAENLPRFLAEINTADFVTGYRLDRQDPWLRRALSKLFNRAVRAAFKVSIRDTNCAFRVFRRPVYESITLQSGHGFLSAELIVKAVRYGFRVEEIEVPHRPRTLGRSTVGLRVLCDTFLDFLRVWRTIDAVRQKPLPADVAVHAPAPDEHVLS